jgi:hypothetical protein
MPLPLDASPEPKTTSVGFTAGPLCAAAAAWRRRRSSDHLATWSRTCRVFSLLRALGSFSGMQAEKVGIGVPSGPSSACVARGEGGEMVKLLLLLLLLLLQT